MGSGFEPAPLSGVSLSGIELFAELDTEIRQKVASRCHGRRYQPRSRILASDEQSSDVFFIVSGDVRVTYYSASGKEVNFRDQHAGQMFGEIAAIDGMGRSAYVMAMSETLLRVNVTGALPAHHDRPSRSGGVVPSASHRAGAQVNRPGDRVSAPLEYAIASTRSSCASRSKRRRALTT